jgi:hypothetical protein
VLFDSGGVLMQPIGGRWNPRADFEPTVLSHCPSVTPEQFAAAIAAGDRFMTAAASTPGHQGRALRRDGPLPRDVPSMTTLTELLALF